MLGTLEHSCSSNTTLVTVGWFNVSSCWFSVGTPKGVGPVKVGQKIDAGITGLLDVHFDVGRRPGVKKQWFT